MKQNFSEHFDAVKMVREIRNRHYEATKNMTQEEKRAFDHQRLEGYYKHLKTINLNDYHFPFIHKKRNNDD